MPVYRNSGITVPDEDIEVFIETHGQPESHAEKIHLHAHDAAARALQAFSEGKHPDECVGLGIDIDWEGAVAGKYRKENP